jgi:beta-galactosidase/beta-glucuronidase
VPRDWRPAAGKRLRLNFGAVDWESTVWVNGREMGTHRGGYTPFSYDVTDALKNGGFGSQEIVVAVYDPADPAKGAYQPKGKQLGSEGIWYTRTTGIWQTVWLEPVNRVIHIAGSVWAPTPPRARFSSMLRLTDRHPR